MQIIPRYHSLAPAFVPGARLFRATHALAGWLRRAADEARMRSRDSAKARRRWLVPAQSLLLRFAVCLLMGVASQAAPGASLIEEGRLAFTIGDYKTAIDKWQELIRQRRPEGWFFLGVMYAEGKGVRRDPAKAFELYSEAAKQDYVPAQYNLGNLYATGDGVGQDYGKAETWWTKAAQAGLVQAQINLGSLYFYGVTGKKDAALARKWLSMAAGKGSTQAKALLAKLDAEKPPATPDTRATAAVTTNDEAAEAAPAQPVAPATAAPASPAGAASAAEPAVATSAATPAVSAPGALRREAWVLAQPAAHFTIQLIAAGSDNEAREFLRQHNLASQAAYIEGVAQGAAVYRILYGSYAARADADRALAALPQALTSKSPWVRTFAELHKLVQPRHAARGAP